MRMERYAAVESGNRVGPKAAGDADDGCELQPSEHLHDRTGVRVLGHVSWVPKVRTNEPQAAQREPMTLVLKR